MAMVGNASKIRDPRASSPTGSVAANSGRSPAPPDPQVSEPETLLQLQVTFDVLEKFFQWLDKDGCGSVASAQLAYYLQFEGLKDSKKLQECLKSPLVRGSMSGNVDFGEFIALMFIWHQNVGDYEALFPKDNNAQGIVRIGLDWLSEAYSRYDFDANGNLSRAEVFSLFRNELPDVPEKRVDDVIDEALNLAPNADMSFPSFMRVIYTALGGKAFALQKHRSWRGQTLKKYLWEAFEVLEKDFDNIDINQSGALTLDEILSPVAHEFEVAPDHLQKNTCKGCGDSQVSWYCPFYKCCEEVCQDCWDSGFRQHMVAAGGLGSKTKRESVIRLIRTTFDRVDFNKNHRLEFFEFVTMAYVLSKYHHYCDLVPGSVDPAKPKGVLLFLADKMKEYDEDLSGDLGHAEMEQFIATHLGDSSPDNARMVYDSIRSRGKVRVVAFFEFLYTILFPQGKYVLINANKPDVQVQEVDLQASDAGYVPLPYIDGLEKRRVRKLLELGEGQWSSVWKIKYYGNLLAAKFPKLTCPPEIRKEMMHCARLQQRLSNCENVVGVAYVHEEEGEECILMELVEGEGDLASIYKKYPDTALRNGPSPITPALQHSVALKMAQTVAIMHKEGIMHRDIKGSNILMTATMDCKLSDFDTCCATPTSTALVGTLGYMAPEVLVGQEYDLSCDIWSFGSLLYEISHNCAPYAVTDGSMGQAQIEESLKRVILSGARPFIDPRRCPQSLQTLISSCWQLNPTKRPTADDIVAQLMGMKHEFVGQEAA